MTLKLRKVIGNSILRYSTYDLQILLSLCTVSELLKAICFSYIGYLELKVSSLLRV